MTNEEAIKQAVEKERERIKTLIRSKFEWAINRKKEWKGKEKRLSPLKQRQQHLSFREIEQVIGRIECYINEPDYVRLKDRVKGV